MSDRNERTCSPQAPAQSIPKCGDKCLLPRVCIKDGCEREAIRCEAMVAPSEARPSEIHSCSYFCDRPECIKSQRDELREQVEQLRRERDAAYSQLKGRGYTPYLDRMNELAKRAEQAEQTSGKWAKDYMRVCGELTASEQREQAVREALQRIEDELTNLQPHIAQLPEQYRPVIDSHVAVSIDAARQAK